MERPRLKFRSSWDDGRYDDVRLSLLLKGFGLPATFYIPSISHLDDQQIRELAKDFEIGGHTVSHPPDIKLLSVHDVEFEVRDNKKWLEELIGKPITKFCFPRGRYNDEVIDVVKMAGFTSARTTEVLKTDYKGEFLEPTTIHVYQRSEYLDHDWYDVALNYASWASASDGLYHLWGHSWEVTKFENWEKLTKLFEHLATNYEIVPS